MFELANKKNDWDWCYQVDSPQNEGGIDNPTQARRLLEKLIKAWDANEIRPSHVYSVINLCNKALNRLDMEYKNKNPVPIYYFSDMQTVGAMLVDVYLKSNALQTCLIGIRNQNELDTNISFWQKNTPRIIIFSFSALNYIDMVKTRGPELKALNTQMFAGGIVFKRSNHEKDCLPFFRFPSNLRMLSKQIQCGIE